MSARATQFLFETKVVIYLITGCLQTVDTIVLYSLTKLTMFLKLLKHQMYNIAYITFENAELDTKVLTSEKLKLTRQKHLYMVATLFS